MLSQVFCAKDYTLFCQHSKIDPRKEFGREFGETKRQKMGCNLHSGTT